MGKLIAILGDIHANIDALNVVLDDCRREGVTDYLCTGDVVGYNAAPAECLRLVRELGCPVVKGNHDDYVSALERDLSDFHPNAAAVVEWTRGQLTDEEIKWLKDLPYIATKAGVSIVHATMDKPGSFGYVFDNAQAEANFVCQKTPVCFHGHTHCPIIYEKTLAGIARAETETFNLTPGRKYFINVGSVGQPRDLDPRAAYVLFDPVRKALRLRRLEYDVEAAQRRILEAGLPARLAQRLAEGR